MKRFLIALGILFIAVYGATIPVMGQTLFLVGIEDMPLMSGMKEDTASMLVFDSSAGRYVEAFAEGVASPQSVEAFYDAALPQLGWEKIAPMRYQREGEALFLEALYEAAEPGMIRIHYILSPIN